MRDISDEDLEAQCSGPTCDLVRPKVILVGRDGNAFAILGACQRAARKANWTKDQIDAFMKQATSGDYDNLLGTAMRYFDVE
jgi:hypothetical protein